MYDEAELNVHVIPCAFGGGEASGWFAKEIRKPTMVVAGRFDQVRPPAASEQFAQTIPAARFELIDAVHMMPAQAAGPLLALLEDFLPAQTASAAQQRAS